MHLLKGRVRIYEGTNPVNRDGRRKKRVVSVINFMLSCASTNTNNKGSQRFQVLYLNALYPFDCKSKMER